MDTFLQQGMYDEYRRMAEDVRSVQKRMAAIRATAESEDGLISATVGGSGELVEVRLDPRIYRVSDSEALANAITGTIRQAAEDAQAEGFAILKDYLPADATPETSDLRFDPLLTDLDREIGGRR